MKGTQSKFCTYSDEQEQSANEKGQEHDLSQRKLRSNAKRSQPEHAKDYDSSSCQARILRPSDAQDSQK